MSKPLQPNLYLTRRHWLALAASAVSGCGGGSASTTASLPGTGGTGYTQGSISGFGSVIVNGIKFDDAQASVNGAIQIDGIRVTSDHLRLGMVAGVQGERGADPALGTASRIEVWSIAQGLVTNLERGVAPEFTVAGVKVQADANTVFYGLANASAVETGQRVAVWGLQAGADDSLRWHATRVERVADTALVSTGMVTATGGLNGLILTGPAAVNLTVGQLVRVRGALTAAGTRLEIERVDVQGPALAMQSKGEVKIEGLVTALTSTTRFTMAGFQVDVSKAMLVIPMGVQIAVGSRLEVQGTWLAGVLIATKVELEGEQSLKTVELKGTINPFTDVSDFEVRGQRCDARQATVSHGSLAELRSGVMVKLKGTKAGDLVLVTELEIVINGD